MREGDTQFPPSWRLQTLENCMSAIIDYRGKSPTKTPYGIPLITAKVVKAGRILPPDEFIDVDEYGDWMRRGIPQPGDVVMTTEAPLGEVAQLGGDKVALAQRLITLRGRPGLLDNTFLKFLMQSRFVQDELRARATGTTVLGIRQSELRKLVLPIPPIQEQERIAEILGALDDKIELNRGINQTLEEIGGAIFKSWFVDFDPVRAKSEGRESNLAWHGVGGFPGNLVNSELGQIPDGWDIGTLYDRADYINGLAFRTEDFSNGRVGLPVIKIGELKDGITSQTKFTVKDLDPKYRIKSGDILFAWSGSPDTSIDIFIWTGVDGWLNQHIFKIEAQHPEERIFVYFLLRFFKPIFIEIARNKQTTGLGHVTAQDLKRLKTPVPPQDALRAFNRVAEPLFQRAHCCRQESVNLCAIRDTLLPKLMTGEMRVKEGEGIIEAHA